MDNIFCIAANKYKLKFNDKDEAISFLYNKNLSLNPYYCSFCNCWHLTKHKVKTHHKKYTKYYPIDIVNEYKLNNPLRKYTLADYIKDNHIIL